MLPLFFILSTSFLFSFKPGEPVATLTCKNNNGAVIFEAIIPSGKYLETATLKEGHKVISYNLEDEAKVVFKPQQKQFLILIDSGTNKQIQLLADSETFKLLKSKKGPGTEFKKLYSFQGNLTTSSAHVVSVDCRFEYEL